MSDNLENCNEYQLKAIYAELNITEKSLESDVQTLIDWLKKQPHLPNVEDKQYLTNVLLQSKNSLEKAKKRLDSLYTLRSLLPEIFTHRDPLASQFQHVIRSVVFIALPKLTPEGDRVIVLWIFDPVKVNEINSDDFWKTVFVILDLGLKRSIHRKLITIMDVENFTLTLGTVFLQGIRKIIPLMPEISIARVNKTILVNFKPSLNKFLTLFKKLINNKWTDRVEIAKIADLKNLLPTDVLPSNYGGNEKSLEELQDVNQITLEQYRDWIISEENVKADLSKITDGRSTNFSDLDRINGSFRKLETD